MTGDNEFNNLIKNEFRMYNNSNSKNKYDISINTNYQKTILSKNSAGTAIDYELSADTIISINFNDKIKILNFKEDINIKNKSNSFNQSVYERNVKKNFASSIKEKFIIKLLDLNDN